MGFLKSIFKGHYSDNVLRDNEIKMNCSGCTYVIILCIIMLAFAILYDWSYYNLSTFIVVGLYTVAALGSMYIVCCHLTQGKARWLKYYAVGLFTVTSLFLAFFTSSGLIALVSIVPMAMASRYYSQRFTLITAIGTYLLLVSIILAGTKLQLTDIQDLNYIQINLSVYDWNDPRLYERVMSAIRSNDIGTSQVMLELTEDCISDNMDVVLKNVEAFHRDGVRLAMDNFGAANTNVTQMLHMPLDMIKIDKDLIAKAHLSSHSMEILSEMVKLFDKFGLEMVAEGVENVNQNDMVLDMGCTFGQGNCYGMPVSQEVFSK
mgnify:CR=1 FL=1